MERKQPVACPKRGEIYLAERLVDGGHGRGFERTEASGEPSLVDRAMTDGSRQAALGRSEEHFGWVDLVDVGQGARRLERNIGDEKRNG